MREIKELLPFWEQLTVEQQQLIHNSVKVKPFKKEEFIHQTDQDCAGLAIVLSGVVRAFMTSKNGKEITLYKLYENDICLFSASCALKDIRIDINISCETETIVYLIPTNIFNKLMNESKVFTDYVNRILSTRFSEIMWLLEQVVFDNMDTRLADYLLNETTNKELHITHEKIAKDLGSAREVISRLLKHFENDDVVSLKRNYIKIINEKKLLEIATK